jgi:hypothetical protein
VYCRIFAAVSRDLGCIADSEKVGHAKWDSSGDAPLICPFGEQHLVR